MTSVYACFENDFKRDSNRGLEKSSSDPLIVIHKTDNFSFFNNCSSFYFDLYSLFIYMGFSIRINLEYYWMKFL